MTEEYVEVVESIVKKILQLCKEGITYSKLVESLDVEKLGRMKIYGIITALYNYDLIDITIIGNTYLIKAVNIDEKKIKEFAKKNYKWIIR